MKKTIAYILFILPFAVSAQSDSLQRPNAFNFEFGYGSSKWTSQNVDNGTHNSIAGGMDYKRKLSEHFYLSVGINFFITPVYTTRDTIVGSDNSTGILRSSYYSVSAKSSVVQMPLKLMYMIKPKGKIKFGIEMSYSIFDRLQHSVLLTPVRDYANISNTDYWAKGSVNVGALGNIGFEILVSVRLKNNVDFLMIPYLFYESPSDTHYGNFLIYGFKVGVALNYKKLKGV